MEQSSDSVFELFLDEEPETTLNPNTAPCSANLDEYKEETEPAFLFKGAYGQASEYSEEGASYSQEINEYTNNAAEYNAEYNDDAPSQQDAPFRTQSKPKIADRIKAFEQLANSKSTEQINKNSDGGEDKPLNENKTELQRQESSSSHYINDEEASHGSYGDIEGRDVM